MEDKSHFTVKEPVPTFGTNSYTDVMYFLNTMRISPEVKEKVGRRLVLEVTAKNLAKAYARLDYLATLEKNWDGEGAFPISRKVLNNLKNVLLISDDDDWERWMIGPEPSGSVGLQSKMTDACISIGSEDYSYYAEIKDQEHHGNHVLFTPSAFLETMRKIG